jgi:hypothetical protein
MAESHLWRNLKSASWDEIYLKKKISSQMYSIFNFSSLSILQGESGTNKWKY